jgi:hypothetical protein
MGYNGGAVVAMVGKNCVAIASDLRHGIKAQTVAGNMPKVRFLSMRNEKNKSVTIVLDLSNL